MTEDLKLGAFAAHLDVLSVWEVAHRWRGYNPDETDPVVLPTAVQDALRFLCHGLAYHRFQSCNDRGIVNKNDNDVLSYRDYEAKYNHSKNSSAQSSQPPDDACYEEYTRYQNAILANHNKATEGLEAVYRHRRFDKERLERVYVTQYTFLEDLKDFGSGLPAADFWMSPKPIDPNSLTDNDGKKPAPTEQKARASQLDKARCQALAHFLWELEPDLTITALTQHKAIRRIGNGALYVEKTLHKWIAEVDTRSEVQKTGRPKE